MNEIPKKQNSGIIGIIGGMGPLATIELQKRILDSTEASKDQDHIRLIIDCNTMIPNRTKSIIDRKSDIVKEIAKSAEILIHAKVDFIIMPCNTVNYFYDKFKFTNDIRVFNMVEETVKYISNGNCNKHCLILATSGTINSNIFQKFNNGNTVSFFTPNNNDIKLLDSIIDLVKAGQVETAKIAFHNLVSRYINEYDLLVIACTELSILYKSGYKTIDTLDVLTKVAINTVKYTYKGQLK